MPLFFSRVNGIPTKYFSVLTVSTVVAMLISCAAVAQPINMDLGIENEATYQSFLEAIASTEYIRTDYAESPKPRVVAASIATQVYAAMNPLAKEADISQFLTQYDQALSQYSTDDPDLNRRSNLLAAIMANDFFDGDAALAGFDLRVGSRTRELMDIDVRNPRSYTEAQRRMIDFENAVIQTFTNSNAWASSLTLGFMDRNIDGQQHSGLRNALRSYFQNNGFEPTPADPSRFDGVAGEDGYMGVNDALAMLPANYGAYQTLIGTVNSASDATSTGIWSQIISGYSELDEQVAILRSELASLDASSILLPEAVQNASDPVCVDRVLMEYRTDLRRISGARAVSDSSALLMLQSSQAGARDIARASRDVTELRSQTSELYGAAKATFEIASIAGQLGVAAATKDPNAIAGASSSVVDYTFSALESAGVLMGPPSFESQVFSEFQAIKEDIQELSIRMDERFDALEAQLVQVYSSLSTQLDSIGTQIRDIQGDVAQIQQQLVTQRSSLEQIEDALWGLSTRVTLNDLVDAMDDILSQDESGSGLPFTTFESTASSMRSEAVTFATLPNESGATADSFSDLDTAIDSIDLSQDGDSAVGRSINTLRTIPNEFFGLPNLNSLQAPATAHWTQSAGAYTQLMRENPWYAAYHFGAGQGLTEFNAMQSIVDQATLTMRGARNQALFEALIEHYQDTLDRLSDRFDTVVATSTASSQHGLLPFSGLDQLVDTSTLPFVQVNLVTPIPEINAVPDAYEPFTTRNDWASMFWMPGTTLETAYAYHLDEIARAPQPPEQAVFTIGYSTNFDESIMSTSLTMTMRSDVFAGGRLYKSDVGLTSSFQSYVTVNAMEVNQFGETGVGNQYTNNFILEDMFFNDWAALTVLDWWAGSNFRTDVISPTIGGAYDTARYGGLLVHQQTSDFVQFLIVPRGEVNQTQVSLEEYLKYQQERWQAQIWEAMLNDTEAPGILRELNNAVKLIDAYVTLSMPGLINEDPVIQSALRGNNVLDPTQTYALGLAPFEVFASFPELSFPINDRFESDLPGELTEFESRLFDALDDDRPLHPYLSWIEAELDQFRRNIYRLAIDDHYVNAGVLEITDPSMGVLANDVRQIKLNDPKAGVEFFPIEVASFEQQAFPNSDGSGAPVGTVTMNAADGTFTFTPNEGFEGPAYFSYVTRGFVGEIGGQIRSVLSDPATVRVDVPVLYEVPVEFGTIQQAINQIPSGEQGVIELAPGTYTELINTMGKAFTLRSASADPRDTIISGGDAGTVLTIISDEGADTLIQGITFQDGLNLTAPFGGAVFIDGASPRFESCWFRDSRGFRGGAVSAQNADVTFRNCLFTDNTTPNFGGAFRVTQSTIRLASCTITNNFSGTELGRAYTSTGADSLLVMSNTIISEGVDDPIHIVDGSGYAIRSNVNGGLPVQIQDAGGNIDADPMFNDPSFQDYGLQSGSPSVDAGGNGVVELVGVEFDIFGNPRFVDDLNTPDTGAGTAPIVDMGAVEWQPNTCLADLNSDGTVNFFDISAFLAAFGNADPIADFTDDGIWNFFDVSAFLTAFGAGCP